MAIVVDKKAWIKPTHWHYSHVIGDSVNITCTYSPWHTIPSSWGSMSIRCFVHASFLPSDAYDSSSAWFIHNKALPEGVVSYNVHICDGTSVPHPLPHPIPHVTESITTGLHPSILFARPCLQTHHICRRNVKLHLTHFQDGRGRLALIMQN